MSAPPVVYRIAVCTAIVVLLYAAVVPSARGDGRVDYVASLVPHCAALLNTVPIARAPRATCCNVGPVVNGVRARMCAPDVQCPRLRDFDGYLDRRFVYNSAPVCVAIRDTIEDFADDPPDPVPYTPPDPRIDQRTQRCPECERMIRTVAPLGSLLGGMVE